MFAKLEGLVFPLCLHSELAYVLMQDYREWTYADFWLNSKMRFEPVKLFYERMINCGLICILNKIVCVCVWLKLAEAIKYTDRVRLWCKFSDEEIKSVCSSKRGMQMPAVWLALLML